MADYNMRVHFIADARYNKMSVTHLLLFLFYYYFFFGVCLEKIFSD